MSVSVYECGRGEGGGGGAGVEGGARVWCERVLCEGVGKSDLMESQIPQDKAFCAFGMSAKKNDRNGQLMVHPRKRVGETTDSAMIVSVACLDALHSASIFFAFFSFSVFGTNFFY